MHNETLTAPTVSSSLAQISTLPIELLEAVLLELEWADVLRARVTCRSLYDASKSLALWRRSFHQISDSYTVPIFPPKPLETYTSPALEHLVVKWLRADSLWSPSATRKFRYIRPSNMKSSFTLTEGGRWLLSTDDSDKGSVYVHFLDSESSEIGSALLIRNRVDDAAVTDTHSEVDRSSPILAFNLCPVYEEYNSVPDHGRVEIWRVVEDADAKLSANKVTTFFTRLPDGVRTYFSTSFLGPWFARFHGLKVIEVYNWQRSSDWNHCKPVFSGMSRGTRPEHAVWLWLLHGCKMLMKSENGFSVLAVPEPSHVSAVQPKSVEPSHLFNLALPPLDSIVRESPSPCIGDQNDMYTVVATSSAIYLVHIVHHEVIVTTLLTTPFLYELGFPLGVHRALVNLSKQFTAINMNMECTMKYYTRSDSGPYGAYGARPATDGQSQ